MLTTHSILEGMGVGNAEASALAATLSWLVRDGAGMLSSLAFSTWGAQRFDLDVKTWRLFADTINDFALLLEFSVPLLPKQYFLPLLCVSAVCKALCSVAAGCTRGVISQHFAGPSDGRNLSDVAAKESTQETAVRLLGLWSGYMVAPWLLADAQRAAASFLLLTALHAAANYAGISCLALTTLNINRLDTVLEHAVVAANAKQLPGVPGSQGAPSSLVETVAARTSNGAVLVNIFSPKSLGIGAFGAVLALQEYAGLLEGHRLTQRQGGQRGWLDFAVHLLHGLLIWPLRKSFLCACVICGWFWGLLRLAPPADRPAAVQPIGLAALLPTPAQVATDEPLVPARAWSLMAGALLCAWGRLQCASPRQRCSLEVGSSLHTVLQALDTPACGGYAGYASSCCRTRGEGLTVRDRAALNLALQSVQAGRSSLVSLQFPAGGVSWGCACAVRIVLPEACTVQQRFQAYATASLLRPLLESGLLAHAAKDTVQDAVQTCAAAATAVWGCFQSHAQQHAQLPWAHRWQHQQLLLPDEGWRLATLRATTARSDAVPKQATADELDELLADHDAEHTLDDAVPPETAKLRARSTGRRRGHE